MLNKLPDQIPVFPLNGVIYFPKTNLPLNIFEERYLDLVNDAMKRDKLMGMVQSKKKDDEVYNIGCLGKISDFKKSPDGRLLINWTGISRFEIVNELDKKFFNKNGLLLNWKEFDKLEKLQKINTLAMIAPITNEEKQKILESISQHEKVKTLEDIIKFYSHESNFRNQTIQ